jgi:hypothetical protein
VLPVRLVRAGEDLGQSGRIDPPRRPGQRRDAQPRAEEAGRAGLVGGDVRRGVRRDGLVRRDKGRQRQGVGGGAAGGEPDLRVRVQIRSPARALTPSAP